MSKITDITKVFKILSETNISGSLISTYVNVNREGIYSYFYKRPYLMELFLRNYLPSEKEKKRVTIVRFSQKFEGESLLVYTELVITFLYTTEEMVVKVHLTIPKDTYLVRNMICIPELVSQLLSGGSLMDVLKVNSSREGELIWNI